MNLLLALLFSILSCRLKLLDAAVTFVLPSEEVRQLLGLNRELTYIRNGEVAYNAVKFPIPISADLDAVHFSWFNPDPLLPVSYKLVIKVVAGNDKDDGEEVPVVADGNNVPMHQPYVNISHSGQIPQTPTLWRVALPCTGWKEGNVNVIIDITLTGQLGAVSGVGINSEGASEAKKSPPVTKLRLRRSKTCTSGSSSDHPANGNTSSGGGGRRDEVPAGSSPHMVFLGALLSAVIVVVLLIIVVVIIHMRSRNKFPSPATKSAPPLSGPSASATSTTTFMQQQQHIYEPIPAMTMMHPAYNTNSLLNRPVGPLGFAHSRPESPLPKSELRQRHFATVPASNFDMGLMSDAAESRVTDWIQQQQRDLLQEEPSPERDPQVIFDSLQVDRSRLKLGSLLQEGTFGRVYQGLFSSDNGTEQDVMIKTVLTGSSTHQSQLLIVEGVRLQSVVPAHKNLLQVLAATWDGTSPMLIYPYSAQGNFKQYLTKFAAGGLSTHQVVRMGIHLLSAMGHLHKRGIIHRDIAARNCFLGEGPSLKLADSALSRDLFPNDYHCLGDNENRPIKWMPVEAIAQGAFSRASDVWSFGVVLWELMTRAQQPYPEIDPFEMEAYLNEGYRLPQPLNCPDQLFSVLVSCWGTRPQERASLQQLHQSLQALHRQLQQFV